MKQKGCHPHEKEGHCHSKGHRHGHEEGEGRSHHHSHTQDDEKVTATPMAIYTLMRKAQALPSTSNVTVIGTGEVVEGAATLSLPQAVWEALPLAQGDMSGYHAAQGNFAVSTDNVSRTLLGGAHI